MSEDYLDAACPALSEGFFSSLGVGSLLGVVCVKVRSLYQQLKITELLRVVAHLFMFGRVFSLSSVAYARYENIKPDHRSIRTQSRV